MQKVPTLVIFILGITAQWLSLQAQDTLSGNWEGAIDIRGTKLTIITHFKTAENRFEGTIDIPQQGAKGIPLQKINLSKKDSVHFEFMAGMGIAKFRGTVKSDTAIAGTFHQSDQKFPFQLEKISQSQNNVSEKAKNDDKIIDYHSQEIIIKNDSISIGGTLTWPEDEQTNRLVIMISGSGAQDRDESLEPVTSFKPFAVLADSLTMSGLATFRYDDRGIGESTGNFSQTSLPMLASDVEAIIKHFSQPSADHHFQNIVLLGHSQGGVVGGKVAAENSAVDKLILMSSPGVSLAKTVIKQVEVLNEQKNIPDSVIAQNIEIQKVIFDTLRGSQNFTQIEDTLVKYDMKNYKNAPDSSQKSILNPKNFFRSKVKQELRYMQSPSYLSFLDYEPVKDLQKLEIPVLVLFGGKDTQVSLDMNKTPIKKALESAGISYKIEIFPNANHLYQHAKTGAVSEYSELPNKFVDGFLATIIQWIKTN